MKSGKIEILAPCGSYESVEAAVRQGADAVYIGALRFSARAYAENFGEEELERAIKYCRLHGVKAYLAVNTVVADDELHQALDTVKKAYIMGADAFIVQDLGLARMIKKACPGAALHASTQAAVHTPQGARMMYSLGFERVVLARELNKNEIADIVKSCPVETEVFVHGALCMCMSGQCYLSAMLGGRSGNRGRCAQPCRLPFAVENGTGHDLSLKDNSIINELPYLESIGVTSAKIEGRMKRPEYTAAAVSACRQARDEGFADAESLERLRAVFSRSGFTDGYFNGRLGREMFGTRSKEDVVSADSGTLAKLRLLYKDEVRTNSVSMKLTLRSGSPAELKAKCGDFEVTVHGDVPQTARTVPLSAERASSQLAKTGGTAFEAACVQIDLDEGKDLTLPTSSLNSMRREALSLIEQHLTSADNREAYEIEQTRKAPRRAAGEIEYRAHFKNCDIADCFKKCGLVYVPLDSEPERIKSLMQRGFNVGVEVPRAFFGMEERVEHKLRQAVSVGVKHAYCGNIGAAALALKLGFDVHGGFALNIFNSESVSAYEDIGLCDTELSIELTAAKMNDISSEIPLGAVGYGFLPLMITRNCPNKTCGGCKTCGGRSFITDRKGKRFGLMCTSGCTELLNCSALKLADKQDKFKSVDFLSLRFTTETADEQEQIFREYLNRSKPSGEYTRGLYFRGVE